MDKFIAVFKREYLERVRTRTFVFATVFGPVLFGAIMVVPAYIAAKSMKNAHLERIEIIDASGVGLGAQVRTLLIQPKADTTAAKPDSATITVRTVDAGGVAKAEDNATARVMSKALTGYIVLDSATVAGNRARYAGRNASAVGEIQVLETAIRQTVLRNRLEREGLNPDKIAALINVRLQMAAERITDKGRGGSGIASTILGFALAFLLYMSLILYGQNTLRSVIEEKTTRVAEVIVASVRTDVLLAGKVLGVSAVGLTQQLFWAASAFVMYNGRAQLFAKLGLPNAQGITLPHVSAGVWIAFLLFFMLGFVFYSSLFAAAGATVSSDQEAQQAASPILMMIVASIIFLNPILVAPSSTLAKVLSWMPFSAPIVMPLRMSLIALDPLEIILVLTGLAVASLAAIWLASRIYRVGLLMYGKKPTFRELGRWIASS
jgi:ABC-2 type transport system permease protein